eukprot:TRINITY_DN17129_c0_g1_i5.p1 TRINITY_DN17129_c0_g1~~TRINITY_DN17129_c0_g1_i5.p1  ORF type:complete len:1048 (+),score=240.21 TRINITY_DN17129_c0_g1_i5:122-3265(+)
MAVGDRLPFQEDIGFMQPGAGQKWHGVDKEGSTDEGSESLGAGSLLSVLLEEAAAAERRAEALQRQSWLQEGAATKIQSWFRCVLARRSRQAALTLASRARLPSPLTTLTRVDHSPPKWLKDGAATLIQSLVRCWLARARCAQLKADKQRQLRRARSNAQRRHARELVESQRRAAAAVVVQRWFRTLLEDRHARLMRFAAERESRRRERRRVEETLQAMARADEHARDVRAAEEQRRRALKVKEQKRHDAAVAIQSLVRGKADRRRVQQLRDHLASRRALRLQAHRLKMAARRVRLPPTTPAAQFPPSQSSLPSRAPMCRTEEGQDEGEHSIHVPAATARCEEQRSVVTLEPAEEPSVPPMQLERPSSTCASRRASVEEEDRLKRALVAAVQDAEKPCSSLPEGAEQAASGADTSRPRAASSVTADREAASFFEKILGALEGDWPSAPESCHDETVTSVASEQEASPQSVAKPYSEDEGAASEAAASSSATASFTDGCQYGLDGSASEAQDEAAPEEGASELSADDRGDIPAAVWQSSEEQSPKEAECILGSIEEEGDDDPVQLATGQTCHNNEGTGVEETRRRESAALLLQRWWRSDIVRQRKQRRLQQQAEEERRRRLKNLQRELVEIRIRAFQERRQTSAAKTLQAWLRGCLARRYVARLRADHEAARRAELERQRKAAVVRIQAMEEKRRHLAAIKLQCCCRGYLARRTRQRLLEDRVEQKLRLREEAAAARRRKSEEAVSRVREKEKRLRLLAACRLQSYWRMRLAKKERRRLQVLRRAEEEKHRNAWLARRRSEDARRKSLQDVAARLESSTARQQEEKAAIRVQSCVRGHFARRRWRVLLTLRRQADERAEAERQEARQRERAAILRRLRDMEKRNATAGADTQVRPMKPGGSPPNQVVRRLGFEDRRSQASSAASVSSTCMSELWEDDQHCSGGRQDAEEATFRLPPQDTSALSRSERQRLRQQADTDADAAPTRMRQLQQAAAAAQRQGGHKSDFLSEATAAASRGTSPQSSIASGCTASSTRRLNLPSFCSLAVDCE